MDNKDFDKILQDKLRQISEEDFEFQSESWERFQTKMKPQKPQKRFGDVAVWFKSYGVAAAIVLLLFCNAFIGQQLVQTKRQVYLLHTQITSLQKELVAYQKRQTIEISSQLVENQGLSSTDTVALMPNLKDQLTTSIVASQQPSFFSPFTKKKLPSRDNLKISSVVPSFQKQDSAQEIVKQSFEIQNTAVEQILPELTEMTYLSLQPIHWRIEDSTQRFHLTAAPEIEPFKRKLDFRQHLTRLLETAQPTAHQIGVVFQGGNANLTNGNALLVSGGINASTLFFNRLRLGVGLQLFNQAVLIEPVVDANYREVLDYLPIEEPHYPSDVLTKIEGNLQGFEIPLTLRLMLRPDRRLNPYLGVGLIARNFDNYHGEYYFYSVLNDDLYETKEVAKLHHFGLDYWQAMGGVDFSIKNGWGASLEAQWQQNFRTPNVGVQSVKQVGGRVSLYYQF